jgi:hypothetical protein
MGTQNKSENGSCAWVALFAHPTHADTDQCEIHKYVGYTVKRLRLNLT